MSSMECITNAMNPYMCSGMYTQEIHNEISKCNQLDIELFLNIIGCKNTRHLTVNEYIVGVNTEKTIAKNVLSFMFKTLENYRLYFYDIVSLRNLIDNKEPIIIKQIYCDICNKRHIIMLIIDKIRQKILLFDSNCENHVTVFIEQTISKIINNYNSIYSVNYSVEQVIYNVRKKLNRFETTNINGLCVIISFLITHYMLLTQCPLSHSIEIFSTLTDIELLTIIRAYSLFYYMSCEKI